MPASSTDIHHPRQSLSSQNGAGAEFRRPSPLHATYSSRLNQVELEFATSEREVIARVVFTSVPDLERKLRRYVNAYSANAQPIQWKYSGPCRHIRSNERSATGPGPSNRIPHTKSRDGGVHVSLFRVEAAPHCGLTRTLATAHHSQTSNLCIMHYVKP